MEWERTETNSTPLNWNEPNRAQLNWVETNWTEPNANELKWTEPNSTRLTWNELNRTHFKSAPTQFCHPWGGGPELQTPTTTFIPSTPHKHHTNTLNIQETIQNTKEEVSKGDRGGRGMSPNHWNSLGISRFRRRPRIRASKGPIRPSCRKIPACVKSAPQNPT